MSAAVELAFSRHGPEGAPTIVLLHGLGVLGGWWPPPFVGRLAVDHDVVVPDLRDSGASPSLGHLGTAQQAVESWADGAASAPPYTLGEVADDVVALLDRLGVRRAHVVGASMGGMVAQHLAFGHPSRVASLVSIMSTTGAPELPTGDPEVLAGLVEDVERTDEESFVREAVARARRDSRSPLFDAQDAARRARLYWRADVDPDASGRHLAAVLADGDRTDRLAAVTVPTLVVHGTRDATLPLETGRATADAIPGASFLELVDVGHELPSAVHDEVADAIIDHVRQAEGAATS